MQEDVFVFVTFTLTAMLTMQCYTTSCPSSFKREARSASLIASVSRWAMTTPIGAGETLFCDGGCCREYMRWITSDIECIHHPMTVNFHRRKLTLAHKHLSQACVFGNTHLSVECAADESDALEQKGARLWYFLCFILVSHHFYTHTLSLCLLSITYFPMALLRDSRYSWFILGRAACTQSFICPVKQFSPLTG